MSIFDYLLPSGWTPKAVATCAETDTLCRATDAVGLGQYHLPQMLQNLLSGVNYYTGGYISPMTATVTTSAVVATGMSLLAIRQLRTDVSKLVTKDLFEAIKGDAELLKKFKALSPTVLADIKKMSKADARAFAAKMKEAKDGQANFGIRFANMNEQAQSAAVKGFVELRADKLVNAQQAKQAPAATTDKIAAVLSWLQPSKYDWSKSYINPWAYGKKADSKKVDDKKVDDKKVDDKKVDDKKVDDKKVDDKKVDDKKADDKTSTPVNDGTTPVVTPVVTPAPVKRGRFAALQQ